MSGAGDGDASCPFCAIARGEGAASVVDEDATTIAFLDLVQFHPGHVLVVPRHHVPDIRALDATTGAALMASVVRVARAVDAAFPSDGLSVWSSAGAGANQEVPHLHVHVHPRRSGDDALRMYPTPPARPDRATLDAWAARIRDTMRRLG